MKRYGYIMSLIGLLCTFFWIGTVQAEEAVKTGTLTVHISGIPNDEGVIRIALFNNKDNFEQKKQDAKLTYRHSPLPIKNGTAVWELKDIPYGVYGIKLYHDQDNSGELKRSFTGRPLESVGFSNNPQLGRHAPSFDEVKFTVDRPETEMTIEMITG